PVPFDAATGAPTHHAKQAGSSGTVADFDVADGLALQPDALHEVRPELFDVVRIDGVQLRVDVDGRLLLVERVEGPPIAPAKMKGAFGAVEVGADQRLFRGVATIMALLPGAEKTLELKVDRLRVGRVGRVLTDIAAGGGEDFLRVRFLGPPKNL